MNEEKTVDPTKFGTLSPAPQNHDAKRADTNAAIPFNRIQHDPNDDSSKNLIDLIYDGIDGLAEAAGFTLSLEQGQNVALLDWPLHVADNRARCIIDELDTHLGDASSRAGAAEDLDNSAKLGGLVLHLDEALCNNTPSKKRTEKRETSIEKKMGIGNEWRSQWVTLG